jgi:hypothetical protein
VPLRVSIAGDLVATTAAVAIGHSTSAQTGERVLGQAPGQLLDCGGVLCNGARWLNPFRSGTFEPGFAVTARQVDWQLRIVTMIHGRSFDDARSLIDSAIASEGAGATATFLFMDGADPARGVLDWEYVSLIAELRALGLTAERVPFAPDLSGQSLAAFFVGTAGLGATIEDNDFAPGAVVDNVTSFGAVPANFGDPSEEVQVSIARWVAKGVAGVHGTVDEPLNNVFPSRRLIVDYASGGTLGEAYARNLPFVYWKNLVLGDPMAAPYARRPSVTIEVIDDRITVTATHSEGIESTTLYVDGVPHLDPILPHRTVELLAVAQAGGEHRPKGWISTTVTPQPPVEPMDASAIDAEAPDAGETIDAAQEMPRAEEGCACSSARPSGASLLLLVVLTAGSRRRCSRSPSRCRPPARR